jgi:hypothetical protein
VDSKVCNSYLLFILVSRFFTTVIAWTKLIFSSYTLQDFSLLRSWSRGTSYELRFPGRSGWHGSTTTPVDRLVHGPVATRDAHVPPLCRRDDSQSRGRRYVGRTVVCWAGDGAHRHTRDVTGWLPCSVREDSSERSHAGAVRALRRHPRAHLDLDPAVQRTWF